MKMSARWMRRGVVVLAAGLLVAGGPAHAGDDPHDPYEGFNRAMFAVNEGLDKVAFKPIAEVYDEAMPLPARAGIGNFFDNIADLRNALNNTLQGKVSEAGSDLGRLLINSTLGIFGLFDVASELGIERHQEDFGQTLAVWGAGDGGFIYWPFVGPSTVRDTFGVLGDIYSDPVWGTINKTPATRNSLVGLPFVETRASLLPTDKVVEEAALDKYAYIRDAYLQRRRSLIFDGRPPRVDDDY